MLFDGELLWVEALGEGVIAEWLGGRIVEAEEWLSLRNELTMPVEGFAEGWSGRNGRRI